MKLKNYLSSLTFRKWILILVSVLVISFVYTTVGLVIVHKKYGIPFSYENNGTDLTFKSADGIWSDEENLLRGKNFRDVVVSFELYKIQCNKPDAVLQRTKPEKKPWNEAWWFDNYDSPKWKVPYVAHTPLVFTNNQDCHKQKPSAKELIYAEEQADLYISSLQKAE